MNPQATPGYHTVLHFIPGQRRGFIETHDTEGNWRGSQRVDALSMYRVHPGAPSHAEQDRQHLYETGYRLAEQNAACHGARLERYSVAEPGVDRV